MTASEYRRLTGQSAPPAKRQRASTPGAGAADTLVWQIAHTAPWLPVPTREFQFHDQRRWRFDLAWPDHRIAVEIEGVVFPRRTDDDRTVLRGRHVSPAGFLADCEKYGVAFAHGWSVLRVAPKQVTSGFALQQLVTRFEALL